MVATTAQLDAEALYSARNSAEYEQPWSDRRLAYEFLPTKGEDWQTALGAQRQLASTGRHRAVGMADLLIATLANAHDVHRRVCEYAGCVFLGEHDMVNRRMALYALARTADDAPKPVGA